MIQLDEKYDVNIRDYRTPDFLVAEEPQFFAPLYEMDQLSEAQIKNFTLISKLG